MSVVVTKLPGGKTRTKLVSVNKTSPLMYSVLYTQPAGLRTRTKKIIPTTTQAMSVIYTRLPDGKTRTKLVPVAPTKSTKPVYTIILTQPPELVRTRKIPKLDESPDVSVIYSKLPGGKTRTILVTKPATTPPVYSIYVTHAPGIKTRMTAWEKIRGKTRTTEWELGESPISSIVSKLPDGQTRFELIKPSSKSAIEPESSTEMKPSKRVTRVYSFSWAKTKPSLPDRISIAPPSVPVWPFKKTPKSQSMPTNKTISTTPITTESGAPSTESTTSAEETTPETSSRPLIRTKSTVSTTPLTTESEPPSTEKSTKSTEAEDETTEPDDKPSSPKYPWTTKSDADKTTGSSKPAKSEPSKGSPKYPWPKTSGTAKTDGSTKPTKSDPRDKMSTEAPDIGGADTALSEFHVRTSPSLKIRRTSPGRPITCGTGAPKITKPSVKKRFTMTRCFRIGASTASPDKDITCTKEIETRWIAKIRACTIDRVKLAGHAVNNVIDLLKVPNVKPYVIYCIHIYGDTKCRAKNFNLFEERSYKEVILAGRYGEQALNYIRLSNVSMAVKKCLLMTNEEKADECLPGFHEMLVNLIVHLENVPFLMQKQKNASCLPAEFSQCNLESRQYLEKVISMIFQVCIRLTSVNEPGACEQYQDEADHSCTTEEIDSFTPEVKKCMNDKMLSGKESDEEKNKPDILKHVARCVHLGFSYCSVREWAVFRKLLGPMIEIVNEAEDGNCQKSLTLDNLEPCCSNLLQVSLTLNTSHSDKKGFLSHTKCVAVALKGCSDDTINSFIHLLEILLMHTLPEYDDKVSNEIAPAATKGPYVTTLRTRPGGQGYTACETVEAGDCRFLAPHNISHGEPLVVRRKCTQQTLKSWYQKFLSCFNDAGEKEKKEHQSEDLEWTATILKECVDKVKSLPCTPFGTIFLDYVVNIFKMLITPKPGKDEEDCMKSIDDFDPETCNSILFEYIVIAPGMEGKMDRSKGAKAEDCLANSLRDCKKTVAQALVYVLYNAANGKADEDAQYIYCEPVSLSTNAMRVEFQTTCNPGLSWSITTESSVKRTTKKERRRRQEAKKQLSIFEKLNDTVDRNYYEISSKDKASVQKRDDPFDQRCKTETATLWPQHFHDCFWDKKWADNAQDLNNIIKRNLKYAKDCLDVSDKKCLLSKEGFETLMNSIIDQMKDFAKTYLEEIRNGRDKILDLQCVEHLDYQDFENCLYSPHVNLTANEKELQRKVENAAACFNSQNSKCSCDAKYTLNSMMKKVFQLQNFNYPYCKDPEKEPWQWYDYIVQPLKMAWNGIKSFFSNLFG